MTRWINEFNQSPFKSTWAALLAAVASLDVDDQTVAVTVEELARLRKVISFIDGIVVSADVELTPRSVWTAAQSQAEACLQNANVFGSNRDPAHLVQANEHADNLLTYLRPYMIAPEQALEAHGDAVRKFAGLVSGYVESFQKGASKSQAELATAVKDALSQKEKIDAVELRVKQFDNYLYEGVDGNASAETYLKDMIEQVETMHSEIEVFHRKLLLGEGSTSSEIDDLDKKIRQLHATLTSLVNSSTSEQKELSDFYDRIFGSFKNDRFDVREGGLKLELDTRLNQLSEYENSQKTRHDAIFAKVESLLPGATSAGLATAYKALKDKFSDPITNYTRGFYGSLLMLFLGGLVMVSSTFTVFPTFHVEFVKAQDWDEMLRTFLTRIPIVVPIVWIAIFSATRRSQYERLQQEYAHKEAIASSYESYKKQLQDLKVDADVLQRELIAKAVEAITYNASITLDGKHAEKPPIFQIFEKLNVDELKKLVDLAKGK